MNFYPKKTTYRSQTIIPSYHHKPQDRLSKPFEISVPENHPTSPLHFTSFHQVRPNTTSRKPRELYYDPNNRSIVKVPQFIGDFECGNLGQVYRIGKNKYEVHLLPEPNDQ